MTVIRPPLRRVVEIHGATVTLECGHTHDRAKRSDLDQPRRMQCVTCLPITERRAWMEQNIRARKDRRDK